METERSGRREILKVHVAKVQLAANVDLDQIAGLTPGFTGADLANLVNEAAIVATRRKGDAVTLDDFTVAIERIIANWLREHNAATRQVARVAFHGLDLYSLCFLLARHERFAESQILL